MGAPLFTVTLDATGYVGVENPPGSGSYPRQSLRKVHIKPGVTATLRDGGASGTIKDVLTAPAAESLVSNYAERGLEFETDLHVTIAGGTGTQKVVLFFTGKQPG